MEAVHPLELPSLEQDGARSLPPVANDSYIDVLRMENKELRELVVQLSSIILRNVLRAP